jgi:hypothetical protein
MEPCKSEECGWRVELKSVKNAVISKVDEYRRETKEAIQKVDERHEKARLELERKVTGELTRGSDRFTKITEDLGDIKGALKVKADKSKVADDIREVSDNNQKMNDKITYLIIGMLSSGFIALILRILTK